MILLISVLPALWEWRYAPELAGDDRGQYLMHAEALAEGRAYTDIGYIYSDLVPQAGPRIAPPGLPLTVAPILALAGRSEFLLRLFTVMSFVAFIFVAGRYFAHRDEAWQGFLAALLVGIALQARFIPSALVPDFMFAVLIWTVIALVDSPLPWSRRRTTLITACGVGAFLYRTAALPLIPALAVFWMMNLRTLRLRPLVPLLVWLAVFGIGYGLLNVGAIPSIPEGTELGAIAASEQAPALLDRLGRMATRAWMYRGAIFESHLYPFPSKPFNAGYHVVSLALMAVGLALWIGGAWRRFVVLFAVMYCGMLLVIPVKASRYLWPLFPIFAFGLVRGVAWVADRLPPAGRGARYTAAAMGLMALLALGRQAASPPPGPLISDPALQSLFRTARQRHALVPMRAAFVKPRIFAWETRIPTISLMTAPRDMLLAELHDQEISHIILGDLGLRTWVGDFWRELIQERPDLFLREFESSEFSIYRVTLGGDGEGSPPR